MKLATNVTLLFYNRKDTISRLPAWSMDATYRYWALLCRPGVLFLMKFLQ